MKKIFKDIRFWVILFFVIRLYGITFPPLEVSHNWRQTTVTMPARNFLEVDNNIFYPRIDFAGEKTGITGMEFPLLNYLIYLLAKIFGYQHWYGRLINLFVSSLGVWFFYKLVRKYFDEEVSFSATIILLVSLWFHYSRKIMPDTFSTSFIIFSLYYGSNYFEQSLDTFKKYKSLVFYSFFLVIGSLSKIPSAYALSFFGIFFLNMKVPIRKKILFSIVTFVSLIPMALWYFYWVPHLVKVYEFWHFYMGTSFLHGIAEILHEPILLFKNFYDETLKYIGFLIFISGFTFAVLKKDKKLLFPFAFLALGFAVIIAKGGWTFLHHAYYMVPFAPVMAWVAGYGIAAIKHKKLSLFLLLAIAVEGIANQQHDFRIANHYLLQLEQQLDAVSHRDDLILINSGDYPTAMYFAHRKGWIAHNHQITKEYIDSLANKGLKYILILHENQKRTINLELPIVIETTSYTFYKVE